MDSLNLKKGKTISELEALFIAVDKLIDEKLEQNPKAGIIIGKGQSNEVRIRYVKLKKRLEILHKFFALKGCFSYGVCQTCSKFNTTSSSTKEFGVCQNRTVHCYDTCSEHSKIGGGFGV